jgi:glutamine amidotransferase
MQVLATKGFEFGEFSGLNIIPGMVKKIPESILPIPHIGWNDLKITKYHPIFTGLENSSDFYFVHSYIFNFENLPNLAIAETNYGVNFPSVIANENIIGVQFHPEKSQQNGQTLLRNFLALR